jgi:hypothetical protein
MRCKTCDYPLWQLTDRRCPECGTPFVPSEYEFILNSVRFCCPHCEQEYYGTGEKGHLVPRTFACVKCARVIDMDQMVLLPTEGVTERQTQVTVVPWVERRERNWFTAFFVTMGMAIGNPNRTIDAVPEGSSGGRAIGYMAIHVASQVVFSGIPFFFGIILMGAMAASGAGSGIGFFAAFALAMIGAPIVVIAWAGLAHLMLRMTGGTAAGFPRTLHAFCYSAGNNFLSAIPCLGFYLCPLGLIWWSIAAGFMLSRGQKVSKGRAALVTAVPIVLLVAMFIGGIVLMAMTLSARSSAAMAAATARVSTPTVWVSDAHAGSGMSGRLKAIADQGETYPAHGAELLLDRRCGPGEFILLGSRSTTSGCTVAGMSIAQLSYGSGSVARAYRTRLRADPSVDSPAHRAGDWVFTYQGILPVETDVELWLAIGWPDPALNPSDPATVIIVRPQGMYHQVDAADFDAALAKQNQLRATHSLPPLPHPRTVLATTRAPVAVPSTSGTPVDPSQPVPDDAPDPAP